MGRWVVIYKVCIFSYFFRGKISIGFLEIIVFNELLFRCLLNWREELGYYFDF